MNENEKKKISVNLRRIDCSFHLQNEKEKEKEKESKYEVQ